MVNPMAEEQNKAVKGPEARDPEPRKKQEEKPAQAKPPKEKPKVMLTTGKRKKAVARARFSPGKGRITLNTLTIGQVESEIMRLRLQEPLVIAGDAWKSWDISVNVKGGGTTGQVDAARQAIARGLVEIMGKGLREKYMALDRNLLVFDPRRTEPHKPPRSSQGPRRYKQRSKR
jgi:small subunit ribosomal protein S9